MASIVSHEIRTVPAPRRVGRRSRRGIAPGPALAWGAWAIMFAAAIWFVAHQGTNVPYFDDWEVVPHLTGDWRVSAEWIWSQHNEHRVPLPRLILLTLYGLTRADFRAGMYFNVVALAALAFAMIAVARRVRGRTSWTDAFFPVVLLHFGHQENILWSWQVAFVTSVVLAAIALLVIVHSGSRLRFTGAVVAGSCVILLPLCGANGLIIALPLALWLGGWGTRAIFRRQAGERAAAVTAFVAACLALVVASVYLIGLQEPAGAHYSVRRADVVRALDQFIGNCFGSNVNGFWDHVADSCWFVLIFCGLVLLKAWFRQPEERTRATGLLLFLAGIAGVALAVALGRPGLGSAPRYMTLASLAMLACYWVGLLYWREVANRRVAVGATLGIAILAAGDVAAVVCLATAGAALVYRWFSVRWVERLLVTLALLMLPANVVLGYYYSEYRSQPTKAFVESVRQGASAEDLAEKYSHGLNRVYPRREVLESYIKMLQKAQLGPFAERTRSP